MNDFAESILQMVTPLNHEHEWIEVEQDPNSELVSLFCAKCEVGISVAPENVAKHLRRTEK